MWFPVVRRRLSVYRVVSRTGVNNVVLFSARSVRLGYGRSEC
nr:MAG TPA: hypothetical protein [Caudoviricetes sp.]